jgi:hypothetical protein
MPRRRENVFREARAAVAAGAIDMRKRQISSPNARQSRLGAARAGRADGYIDRRARTQ